VLCTNTPDVLQQSVAELTMTMIGAAARHVLPLTVATRDGEWKPREGAELQGMTLALIGCGAIAQAVARIAAAGFGMRVVGFTRTPRPTPEHVSSVTTDFAEAVRGADFVSLHIPSSPENARFLDRDRLALLEPGAWVVNTARGAVVDEAALYDALAAGRLGGAALDVFEREPYQPVDAAHDLRTLPNVIMVPHIGSNTVAANRRMAQRALRNAGLGLDGNLSAMDLINPDVLSRR
jgi:phosphoglycerate dehydrogenase-like enzyme